jgi:CRISPR/Cas system-associated endonuclease Cas3-HD
MKIQENEVLLEKTDEDLITVATTSTTLSQATAHNVTMLNEKLSQAESDNNKLKYEIIILKAEVNKRRKMECDTTLLQASILEQQEKLHDVKMECFAEIKKMANKVKMVEKHLEIVSQTNQRMRDLQAKIENLEEWRTTEKNVPSSLLVIKSYDISVHTLATIKCEDLASRFKENA